MVKSFRYGSLFLGSLAICLLTACSQQATMNQYYASSHHTAAGFRNLHEQRAHGFFNAIRWHLGFGPRETPVISPQEIPAYVPDMVQPDLGRIWHPDPAKIQVTWIGHATFLIQVAGMNILTDPMFSERASPLSFIGPRRIVPPGVQLDALPPIDAVIISHNHYDHLDAPTVKKLGNRPRYFVPLGLARWFGKEGITNVVERDWWQETDMGPLKITAVPAQHFSGRDLCDHDTTLWAGWVIQTKTGTIYFAGCSGYAPEFKEIGERFHPIRVSLLPIGGYRPRWFMRVMHMDPAEAVRAHQDLRSEVSIAMHWGTFKLTDEPLAEPPIYLRKALREAGVPRNQFIVMRFGETRVFE